jgi:hypothetical protein
MYWYVCCDIKTYVQALQDVEGAKPNHVTQSYVVGIVLLLQRQQPDR